MQDFLCILRPSAPLNPAMAVLWMSILRFFFQSRVLVVYWFFKFLCYDIRMFWQILFDVVYCIYLPRAFRFPSFNKRKKITRIHDTSGNGFVPENVQYVLRHSKRYRSRETLNALTSSIMTDRWISRNGRPLIVNFPNVFVLFGNEF